MDATIIQDLDYPDGSGNTSIFDSGEKGPTILVASGVHGNEKGPIEAVQYLLKVAQRAGDLLAGKLVVVPYGNPFAVRDGKRDIGDKDLNRYFGDICEGTIEIEDMNTLEARRAMFLKEIISRGVEYVFDLHSLSGQSRVPFLYCPDDPEKVAFAQKLGVSHIVIGWAKLAEVLRKKGIDRPLRPGLADYANMQEGVTGLTFEAGTHDSPHAERNTREFLANVLAVLGMDTDTRIDRIGGESTVLIDMIDVHLGNNPDNVQFEWIIDQVNFMQFDTRTLVAKDHGVDVYMEPGTVLVQPKAVSAMRPGQEAFFIGKIRP